MFWLKLKWRQFWCVHHLHEVLRVSNVQCGFYNGLRDRVKVYLCCRCGAESDAYAALGGL